MTRPDHERRVAWVLRQARAAADRGESMDHLAALVRIPPKPLRRYLCRHGSDDIVPVLIAHRSTQTTRSHR